MEEKKEQWKKDEYRKKSQDKFNEEIDKDLEIIESAIKERRASLESKVKSANTMPTQEYKRQIVKNNSKKNIKNKPNKERKLNVAKSIVAAILTAGITISGGVVVSNVISDKMEEYNEAKENRFQEALLAVKEEIAKSVGTTADKITIYDKSSITSSVSYNEEYVVNIGGKTFRYNAYYTEGILLSEEDGIKNKNVLDAIKIISSAQDGNYWETKDAEELTEKIKNGEIDLSMEKAMREKVAGENERY